VAESPTITVNGDPLPWREGMTVRDVLDARRFVFRMLAVHVNGTAVPRKRYDRTPVPADADVQVIHMISGG
jgi:sulfur carrier protein